MSDVPRRQLQTEYSEADAARMLDLSVDELRSLIRRHIGTEEDEGGMSQATYYPSDLIMLRLLKRTSPAA